MVKKRNNNKILLTVACALNALMLVLTAVFLNSFEWYAQLGVYVLLVGLLILSFVFYLKDKKPLFRLTLTTTVTVFIILGFFVILYLCGVFEQLSDIQRIKDLILSTGNWGKFLYTILQIIQVLFLPIPAMILDLVGVSLYGSLTAFLLSTLGILIGSMMAFAMGKVFGKKLVGWIVGKEETEKYRKLISNKGRYLLILMMLFPLFPDDLLCIVAGLTAMSYGYFFLVILITRPISNAAICFFGSGDIIPFRGWGLVVWIAIFAFVTVAFILLNKYKGVIIKKFKLFRNKKKKKPSAKIPTESTLADASTGSVKTIK